MTNQTGSTIEQVKVSMPEVLKENNTIKVTEEVIAVDGDDNLIEG